MLFNSFEFLIFYPIVTIAFFALPHQYRWLLLLIASCIFYMYFIPAYILILLGTILIDYFAGIYIENAKEQQTKKRFLAYSIIANVGILAVFKYYDFFLDNFNLISTKISGEPTSFNYLGLLLPIGLSFHTFQAMSYTFEVYYGRQKAEKHLGIYALYVLFYPQLVAGPIERPQNILPQLKEKKQFTYSNFVDGIKMMIWGLFKKVVIADNLSTMVDLAYQHPEDKSGLSLLLATYFFAFQIYCDFSGYSDIAIGAARTMGFNLMENFNVPYLSKNIKTFWSKWHISLSTWFRDYLYIPIGGNRTTAIRNSINLFIVFTVSGIWHGANWTFIVWGCLHGIYIVVGNILEHSGIGFKKTSNVFLKCMSILITFHLTLFAWIFFRANSMEDAMIIINNISNSTFNLHSIIDALDVLSKGEKNLGRTLFLLLLVGIFILVDPYMDALIKKRKTVRFPLFNYILFASIVAGIVLFGFFGEVNFIYFQF